MIIDLVLLAILLLTIFISYKRGILKSLSGLITYVAGAAVTYFFTDTVAIFAYEKMVRGFVIRRISSAITDGTAQQEGNKWYDLVKEASVLSTNPEEISTYITDRFLATSLQQGTKIVVAILLFILTSVLLGIVLHGLSTLVNHHSFGILDHILGGVLGLLKALFLLLVINLILSLAQNMDLLQDTTFMEQIQESYLMEFITRHVTSLVGYWLAARGIALL